MTIRIKIRISLYLLLSIFLGWILYMGLVPSGKISYSYDFSKNNSFISKLSPDTRLEKINKGSQKIIANPVYFNLHTPRKFNKAKLGIYYRSKQTPRPIIETGVMVDKTIWRYALKPVENKRLDKICNSWNKIEENDLLFCQKNNDFINIDDFLASTTDFKKIAVYNYNLDKDFLLKKYATSTSEQNLDIALRGSYQFFTYIKKETMSFDFSFVDLNINNDFDNIDLNLYYNNVLIDTRHLDDDGNHKDNGEESSPRSIKLKVPNLPEGVYKIELRVNNDIITKKIKSKQKIISFINKINIAKNNTATTIKLYTDSQKLEATTIYPESLQTIKIANTDIKIDETYKQFSSILEPSIATSGLNKIILEKDGVVVSGNGIFSFSENSFLNPKFKKVDENLILENSKIQYILANYKSPAHIGTWKYSEISIDLKKAYRENRTYSFIISIPGLKIDALNDFVEINKIKVDLEGDSLMKLLTEKLDLFLNS